MNRSISEEGYADWYPDNTLSQRAPNPILKPARVLSPLERLLSRIASKIEERSHAPRWILQKSFFYRNKSGIRSVEELKAAFEYFHVMLAEGEYHLLFDSFQSPHEPGTFDFKAMSAAMYPRGAEYVAEKEPSKLIAAPRGTTTNIPAVTQLQQHQQQQQHQEEKQEPTPQDAYHYQHDPELIRLSNPEGADFTPSQYYTAPSHQLGTGRGGAFHTEATRQTARRRVAAPGGERTSAELFAPIGSAGAPKQQTKQIPVASLHTMHTARSKAALARSGATTVRTNSHRPHYMSSKSGVSNAAGTEIHSSRYHGGQTCLGMNGNNASQSPSSQQLQQLANHNIPRMDFLNLGKYTGRYERSQATKDFAKQYVHSAR